MTALDFIDATDALILLGLYNPDKKQVKKFEYLTWLVERSLLSRTGSHRCYRYNKSEVTALFERSVKEGLNLRINPKKLAA